MFLPLQAASTLMPFTTAEEVEQDTYNCLSCIITISHAPTGHKVYTLRIRLGANPTAILTSVAPDNHWYKPSHAGFLQAPLYVHHF